VDSAPPFVVVVSSGEPCGWSATALLVVVRGAASGTAAAAAAVGAATGGYLSRMCPSDMSASMPSARRRVSRGLVVVVEAESGRPPASLLAGRAGDEAVDDGNDDAPCGGGGGGGGPPLVLPVLPAVLVRFVSALVLSRLADHTVILTRGPDSLRRAMTSP
jgi:hypothetical protein